MESRTLAFVPSMSSVQRIFRAGLLENARPRFGEAPSISAELLNVLRNPLNVLVKFVDSGSGSNGGREMPFSKRSFAGASPLCSVAGPRLATDIVQYASCALDAAIVFQIKRTDALQSYNNARYDKTRILFIVFVMETAGSKTGSRLGRPLRIALGGNSKIKSRREKSPVWTFRPLSCVRPQKLWYLSCSNNSNYFIVPLIHRVKLAQTEGFRRNRITHINFVSVVIHLYI